MRQFKDIPSCGSESTQHARPACCQINTKCAFWHLSGFQPRFSSVGATSWSRPGGRSYKILLQMTHNILEMVLDDGNNLVGAVQTTPTSNKELFGFECAPLGGKFTLWFNWCKCASMQTHNLISSQSDIVDSGFLNVSIEIARTTKSIYMTSTPNRF